MSDLPDDILPALDFLEEHGFTDAATLIRERMLPTVADAKRQLDIAIRRRDEEIVERYEHGEPLKQIAADVGLSYGAACDRVRSIIRRRQRALEPHEPSVRERRAAAAGLSVEEYSRRLRGRRPPDPHTEHK